LAVSVDENRTTAALVDPVYSRNKSGGLKVSDADGFGFARDTSVADIDVVTSGGEI
jgi:hypothetical protein